MSNKNVLNIVEDIKQKTEEVIELVKSEETCGTNGNPQKAAEFKRLTALSISTFKLASAWAVKRFKI